MFRTLRIATALIAIALTLPACQSGRSVFDGGLSLTATVNNPVTPTMVYEAEQGMIVVVSGLLAYKRLCVAKSIPQTCRDVIKTLQAYTTRAKPLLKDVRAFVRQNDQVNAIIVYRQLLQLVADFRATAAAKGAL